MRIALGLNFSITAVLVIFVWAGYIYLGGSWWDFQPTFMVKSLLAVLQSSTFGCWKKVRSLGAKVFGNVFFFM